MKRQTYYVPPIEDGIPVPTKRAQPRYPLRVRPGELRRLARQMKPGQSVILPVGSITKFRQLVKAEQGLDTVTATRGAARQRVWVIEARP